MEDIALYTTQYLYCECAALCCYEFLVQTLNGSDLCVVSRDDQVSKLATHIMTLIVQQ